MERNDINYKAIPIKARESVSKDKDFIGSYGIPNTYTADLPESIRNQYTRPDSTQRRAYKNPNHSYV